MKLRKTSTIKFVLLLFIAPMFSCHSMAYNKKSENKDEHTNVLLILTDNQSYYELSSNGHNKVETPNIDRFSSNGVVFDNFYATPYCSPSRAELLTGRYSLRYGIHTTVGGVSNLLPGEKTIANYLKGKGYQTGIFGKWHLGNEYPYSPMYRGFDTSVIHDGGGIGQLPDYYGNNHIDAHYNENGEIVQEIGFSTDVLFSKAKSYIETNKEKPFFCFISTPATHSPWQAHPEKLKELEKRNITGEPHEMALYSMIENLDDNVGDILKYLDDSGLRENTMVIIATDQGMGYRGLDNAPKENFFDYSPVAFDNRHKVFCMVQYPGEKQLQPYKNKALTGIVDLAPTILEACNIKIPKDMDGISLIPLLTKERDWKDDRTLIVQCPRQREREMDLNVSIKTKKWRLVNGKLLFDAINDPNQMVDISDQHPKTVDSLKRIHNSFWNSLPTSDNVKLYNFVGVEEMSETRLNAMDWYKGAMPWTQGDIKNKTNGTWALKVLKKSKYQIELRRFPREYEKSIEANLASIEIGEKVYSQKVGKDQSKVLFNVEIDKGTYDFTTYFNSETLFNQKSSWGAKFVYVKTIQK